MESFIDIPKKRRRILIYFIFVFFILPTLHGSGLTTVIGRIIPNPLGYNLLAFILSLPLLRSINKNYGKLKGVVIAIALLIVYIFITFISTIDKTSFYEAITVFRYSYIQALNLFILLPFIFTLTPKEVNYILKNIFKCLIAFTILYLSNNLGIDWMGVKGETTEMFGNVSVERSIIGLPLIDPVWMALLIMYTIMKVPKASKYLILILLALVISFTRNLLFSTAIITLTIIILSTVKDPNKIGHSVKLLSILLIGVIVISIVMPNALDFWIAKLSNTFNNDLKHDVGTYALRERLVSDALYAIRQDPLFGLGYIRDVDKGEYSLVMGGDTHIAPILWCEGWVGLVLRMMPYILLLGSSISNLLSKSRNYWLDIIIIASIVSASANYIQTKAITNYPLILGIILLLKIKDNYDKETQDFSNNSIL